MTIGLFFGSFNPIHHGHLIIANHILNQELVENIWFVVSPQNPFKETRSLLNEHQRLHLVNIAIEEDSRFKASSVEFTLPKPSYTAFTLAHLAEKYPKKKFVLIMGGDSFFNIKKWHNYNYILENYLIIIYSRPGYSIPPETKASLKIINYPMVEISSTEIRKLIKEKKSVKYLLPDKVIQEIEKGGYYKK